MLSQELEVKELEEEVEAGEVEVETPTKKPNQISNPKISPSSSVIVVANLDFATECKKRDEKANLVEEKPDNEPSLLMEIWVWWSEARDS